MRPASPQDAAACVAIYRPYVEDTPISWEIEVPTTTEMAARIAAARDTHEWLVLECDRECDNRIVGFAYGQAFNRLAAFQWSAQTGIYLHAGHHRWGGGSALYTRLLRRLAERGYRRALAGITQPNDASNGFHRSFGFSDVALYRRVAWKQGSWHDVAWMQLDLAADQDGPPGPIAP